MTTLYLHIGHGKTGSSWIQACMRLNRESLASHGIIYAYGDDYHVADSITITSGNAINLFESKASFDQRLEKNIITKSQSLLYSNENIIQQLIKSNGDEYLEEIAAKHGFDKIEILLFIRNPISMHVSVLQQHTKRTGNHHLSLSNLNERAQKRIGEVFFVEKLLHRINKYKNVSITIRNYSNCSHRLMDEVADWLGVPGEIFTLKPSGRINRSLTWSEHRFQISLNKILGTSGGIFSDPLCEKLPDIVPERILPPLEIQEAIWAHLNETIERLNKQIPEEHRYQCDIQHPEPLPDVFTFNQQQIDIIAKSLGNEILDLRNQLENANKTISQLTVEKTYCKEKRKFLQRIISSLKFFHQHLNAGNQIRMIKGSGLFDERYYLDKNPDIKAAGVDPLKHYLFHGGFEGRNPSEKFDSALYLEQNPDVKSSGMNPLIHFVEYGTNEGRQPAKPTSATIVKNPVDNEEYDEHTLNLPVKIVVKNPKKLQSFVLENDGRTEFINRYFDRVYVINLRRRQNKLVEIVQKLKRLNISAEIIEAVDGYKSPHIYEYEAYRKIHDGFKNTHPDEKKLQSKQIYSPGVWGHLKSNRLILKDALAKGYEKILILEDDVMFMKNFHQEFEKFTGTINGKNWDFLYLGATQAFWDIPGSVFYPDKSLSTYQPDLPFYHPVSTFGSFALAIHQLQFNNIIDKIDEMNCPFDWIYTLSFNQLVDQCYVAQPNLIIADMAESDNRPKEESLHDKMLAIQRRKWDLSKYE